MEEVKETVVLHQWGVLQDDLVLLLSYFFVKKYLLVGASSMLWTGQWIIQ